MSYYGRRLSPTFDRQLTLEKDLAITRQLQRSRRMQRQRELQRSRQFQRSRFQSQIRDSHYRKHRQIQSVRAQQEFQEYRARRELQKHQADQQLLRQKLLKEQKQRQLEMNLQIERQNRLRREQQIQYQRQAVLNEERNRMEVLAASKRIKEEHNVKILSQLERQNLNISQAQQQQILLQKELAKIDLQIGSIYDQREARKQRELLQLQKLQIQHFKLKQEMLGSQVRQKAMEDEITSLTRLMV